MFVHRVLFPCIILLCTLLNEINAATYAKIVRDEHFAGISIDDGVQNLQDEHNIAERTTFVTNYTDGYREDDIRGDKIIDELAGGKSPKLCTPQYSCSENGSIELCTCDKICIEYKDCCNTSVHYNPIKMSTPSAYICQEYFYDSNSVTHVFIKKECSLEWKDEKYSTLCSNPGHDYYNISEKNLYGNIPVTGVISDITYRNLFCAICNYENEVYVWNNVSFSPCTRQLFHRETPNTLSLNEMLPGKLQSLAYDGHLWNVNYEGFTYSCDKGSLFIPDRVKNVLHGCTNVPIQNEATCTEASKTQEMENCNNTYALVAVTEKDGKITYYRNRYCASCDGHAEFGCPSGISIDRSLRKKDANFIHVNDTSNPLYLIFPELSTYKIKCKADGNSRTELNCYPTKISGHETVDTMFMWISRTCKVLSTTFLTLHLIVFTVVKELHTLSGKTLASYCLAMSLVYSESLVPLLAEGMLCGVFFYYFTLVSFTWLLTISYDVWRNIRMSITKCRSVRNRKKTFLVYSLCNWLLCLLPTMSLLYLDIFVYDSPLAPRFRGQTIACWFNNGVSAVLFFRVPVFSINLLTCIIYIHTSYLIFVNRFRLNKENSDSDMNISLYMRLAVLTGCSWIICFFGVALVSVVYKQLVVSIFSAIHGLFIFLAFTCKKRNYRYSLKRLGFSETNRK